MAEKGRWWRGRLVEEMKKVAEVGGMTAIAVVVVIAVAVAVTASAAGGASMMEEGWLSDSVLKRPTSKPPS